MVVSESTFSLSSAFLHQCSSLTYHSNKPSKWIASLYAKSNPELPQPRCNTILADIMTPADA